MLNKSDEINILTYKYMKDAVDSIEEALDVLKTLLNIVGFKRRASMECAEFIQSHIKLLKKFLEQDIEVYHGK